MNASIFLAAFLGCLFALGIVAISVWQYAEWRFRFRRLVRKMGPGGGELIDFAMSHEMLRAEVLAGVHRYKTAQKLRDDFADRRHDGTAIGVITCTTCQRTQEVPDCPDGMKFLDGIGWRLNVAKPVALCPFCVDESKAA